MADSSPDRRSYTSHPVLSNLRLVSPPFLVIALVLGAVVVSWIPLGVIARARFSNSEQPRVHIFQDMDNQPRYKPQKANPLFADGRAQRPVIPGTVARGELDLDDHFDRGFVMETGADGKPIARFFTGFPSQVTVNEALLARGRDRYNIYCSVCHGRDGSGAGQIHLRATELGEANWVPPTSFHIEQVRGRPEGHIFNTITNGIRNMSGYGQQLSTQDRWAIVAYVRALQFSRNAPLNVVPQEQAAKMN
jgi:mono/diheme cytochrome c family protein